MNPHLQNILHLIQQDDKLSAKEKESIIRSLKDANKELEIAAFKLERTEKVKKTTAVLLEETIGELEKKRKDVEAQNRELEIESALERVRSAAMSMRDSSELGNLIFHLYAELTKLDAKLDRCFIMIVNPETLGITWWLSGKEGLLDENGFLVQNNDYPSHQLYLKHWREKNANWQYLLEGKEKEEWDQFGFSRTELVKLPDAVKKDMSGVKKTWLSGSSDSFGCLLTGSLEQLSEEHQNILSRFAKVFNQTYTRFLDLQKAEAQARESQIQLALERVRARTMAMQKSDELLDVIKVVAVQMQQLNIQYGFVSFGVISPEGDLDFWMAVRGFAYPEKIHVPFIKNPITTSIIEARENGLNFLTSVFDKIVTQEWMQQLFSNNTASLIMEQSKSFVRDSPGLARSSVLLKHINVYMGNFAMKPFTDEQNSILIRFAHVFEQTYTRFLDLQKAEAQAREAQIEAALERVRSRTMGMQKSGELKDVIRLVYEQLIHLKIHVEHAGFILDYKTRDDVLHIWLADEHLAPSEVIFPWFDCPPNNSIREAKNKGEDFFKYHLTFEEKNKFYRDLFQLIPGVPEETKAYYQNCPGLAGSGVLLESIGLYIENFSGTPYTDEENAVLMRFGKVFQQTYTRFLDLQKAEAQAREAQIEAALERVRSRTMAMQHSDELTPTADLLLEQLKKLGADIQGVAFTICDKNSDIITKWTSIGIFSFPYTIEPAEQSMYEAWKNNVPLYEEVFEGERLRKYYETLMEVPAFKQGLQKMLDAGFPIPTWQKNHAVSFPQGYLLVITTKPFEETQIFVRFGKVFEQTYTRFLDLQKAEALAREAQIEAALERVRARAMSMHASTELKTVATEMRNQLHLLGQKALETCAIHLYDTTPDYIETWAALRLPDADNEMVQVEAAYPKKGIRLLEEAFASYSSGKNDYVLHADQEKEIEFFEEIKKRSSEAYQLVIESTKNKKENEIWAYWSVADFQGGSLVMVTGDEPHEDERKLLRRFANVFGLAYQRFVDLQKAENSAREAIKQAALDRIRADIASMRTTEDLERITPVIWTELKILGIPFIRCGVFIMDEEKELIHTFLSTPEGKAIAAIHIPYNTPGKIQLIPRNWRANIPYTDHWQDTDFVDFANLLAQQKAIASPGEYLSGVPHGGFYLHFVPFLQGMMYVGNATRLNEEETNLVQSIADAFATAYARYEDFNKLEAAKKRVDSTLSELQSTQKQLIQSEKMASLGELTAGIAHEIQNPLNFVNNFSEVSKELLDEMKEAMDKGDSEEAKEIMQDVINNLEKINHHGKRADGIVKGMLQHSRTSTGQKEMTDINALCDEYLRLAYHGLRAKDKSFNAKFETDFDVSLPKVSVMPQEIGRVILNLINNAFYAVSERKKLNEPGYEPTVIVSTRKENDKVEIRVKDNGTGIPKNIVDKIFQPFFTTKPTGKGTGLGLSLAYDIVKAHGGEIKVDSKEGEGTGFVIQIGV